MKTSILVIGLLLSIGCFGQTTVIGRVYSIVTGAPVPKISLRLNKKQLVQADTNGVFKITTTQRKIQISIFPENIFYIDTTLIAKSVTDTVKLFIAFPINAALANFDIEHNQIQFYCGGGIAPLASMPSDKIFETTYSVKYHLLDCLMPDLNDLSSYNQRVALYLDTKYGLDWRQAVRPDVFGVTRKAFH